MMMHSGRAEPSERAEHPSFTPALLLAMLDASDPSRAPAEAAGWRELAATASQGEWRAYWRLRREGAYADAKAGCAAYAAAHPDALAVRHSAIARRAREVASRLAREAWEPPGQSERLEQIEDLVGRAAQALDELVPLAPPPVAPGVAGRRPNAVRPSTRPPRPEAAPEARHEAARHLAALLRAGRVEWPDCPLSWKDTFLHFQRQMVLGDWGLAIAAETVRIALGVASGSVRRGERFVAGPGDAGEMVGRLVRWLEGAISAPPGAAAMPGTGLALDVLPAVLAWLPLVNLRAAGLVSRAWRPVAAALLGDPARELLAAAPRCERMIDFCQFDDRDQRRRFAAESVPFLRAQCLRVFGHSGWGFWALLASIPDTKERQIAFGLLTGGRHVLSVQATKRIVLVLVGGLTRVARSGWVAAAAGPAD